MKSSHATILAIGLVVCAMVLGGAYKYKYCYGRYTTLSQAKSALTTARERFGDAYIVQFVGSNIK